MDASEMFPTDVWGTLPNPMKVSGDGVKVIGCLVVDLLRLCFVDV